MASPLLTPPDGNINSVDTRVPGIEEPDESKMRSFGDASGLRNSVYGKSMAAVQGLAPISNKTHTLSLTNAEWADPDNYSLARQKKAILSGETLGRRIKGTWSLTDNETGKVLDSRSQTVARVPFFSDRGTTIHRGNENVISNQARLNPGVYTRRKDNGELEAHANILPESGRAHRYFLDPDKGTFYMRLSQAKIPIMAVMRSFDIPDKELKADWGEKIYRANIAGGDARNIQKLYSKIVPESQREEDAPLAVQKAGIREAFLRMKMDPQVTRKTLGKEYETMNPDAIRATVSKLLRISKGEAEVDDRDHLAYQSILSPEDLLSERIAKDYGGLQRQLLYKAGRKGNLNPVTPGILNKQIDTVLQGSGLGQSLEEVNTAELLDKFHKLTRMGEGGIPSVDSIPDQSRAVQPSHLGYVDPLRTPESQKVGVDTFLAENTRKGANGKIYTQFVDTSTGGKVWRSPDQIADATVAFPQEKRIRKGRKVAAMRDGKMVFVNRDDVDYELPHMEKAMSPLGNMVPLKSAMKGQRAVMASRMLTQAVPLINPEAPLVQGGIPDAPGESYEERYGSAMGAVRSSEAGRVMDVSDDEIKIKHENGETKTYPMYNNFPFNRKTFAHNTALVKRGGWVEADQLLARSNFTDEAGTAALGMNASVAYIPFEGANFEDAIAVSESAAKRFTSEQAYQQTLDFSDTTKTGRNDFIGLFPSKYDKDVLKTIDKSGFVKAGTVVNYGDPLILAANQKEFSDNKVHRKNQAAYSDASVTWKHHSPGVVTDIVKTKKGVTVLTKSTSALEVGDKLSGRYGDKGVIGKIIPDEDMPKGKDGKPFEVLVNSLGIISRANPSQMLEGVLGKIAAKTGKPYKIRDFEEIDDLNAFVQAEAKKHNVEWDEDITDPETETKIPDVFTGNRFFFKLHHTSESKGQSRGHGGYGMDETPSKGGEDGSKRISMLNVNALMSHGATEVLRDAGSVRGQKNDDWHMAYLQGHTPKKPRVPHVYEKFVSELKGAGINVVSEGSKLNIMALTGKDIDGLAGDREITTGDTVHFDKEMRPVKGGLFDKALTGGHDGQKWSYIRLPEPMPNPVMEEPIRKILGLTQKQMDSIISGEEKFRGGTGPAAIHEALKGINLDKELTLARAAIKSGKKTIKDKAIKKMGYLKSAQRLDLHPREWMVSKVPVLPPKFRPVAVMGDSKIPLVSDPNYLYKELLESRDVYENLNGKVGNAGAERLAMYRSFKAVTGLGDPVHPKLAEKNVKGILKHIFGSSPKHGTVQRRLVGSSVDNVGRAVIIPDPDLDMDSVGIPEDKAWDVFEDSVRRQLKRKGMSMTDALKHVKDRTPLAKRIMEEEMERSPVVVDRAPVLHRFGIMAFRPKLVKGDAMRVSPLVVGGFNADFDGDALQYHLPSTDEARKEALEKMLPSRNLLSPGDFKTPVHMPSKEFAGGLYHATSAKTKRKKVRVFHTVADAKKAFMRGDISATDPVRITKK